MNKALYSLFISIIACQAVAQTPVFKWETGSNEPSQSSVTQTTFMGARENASAWTDDLGNMVLFGGYGPDKDQFLGDHNDMWYYSVADKKWTWVQGEQSAGSQAIDEDDRSIRFDGQDDVIEIPGFINYHSGFTWEAWLITTDTDGTLFEYAESETSSQCCSGNGNISVTLASGNVQAFTGYLASNVARSLAFVSDGKWHHIAVTMQPNQSGNDELIRIFIDGVEDGTLLIDFDDDIPLFSESSYVTKLANGNDGGLLAIMDNFRVWSEPLSQQKIQENRLLRLQGFENGLALIYEFNQGTAEGDNQSELVAIDKTLSANNGQLINFIGHPNLEGFLTQTKIWSVARTASDIMDQRFSADSDQDGLELYFDYSQGTPDSDNTDENVLQDNTAAQNNGTLRNFDLNGTTSNYSEDRISPAFLDNINVLLYEDFEANDGGWIASGPADGFEYGEPVFEISADFGNSWVTDLDGDATALNGVFYLTSPEFDFSSVSEAYVGFDLYTGLYGNDDVLWMEFSTDGTNWERLGSAGEGVNWYDGVSSLYSDQGEGWHLPGTWKSALHDLQQVANEPVVYFRYVFLSDGCCAEMLGGIAIDNFLIYESIQPTLHFDGADDHIGIEGMNIYQSDFTWETWVKTNKDATLFAYSNASFSEAAPTGSIALYIKNGDLSFAQNGNGVLSETFGGSLNDDKWHHVALSLSFDYDGSFDLIQLFIDGEEKTNVQYELLGIPETDAVTLIGQSNFNFPIATGGLGEGDVSNWSEEYVLPRSTIGARSQALALNDSEYNYWLFGGKGIDSDFNTGLFNSLYRFDDEKYEWVHVSGNVLSGQEGSYGTKGVSSADVYPGARSLSGGWVDKDDNLWVFGGQTSVGEDDDWVGFNDLWKYDVAVGEWTWVSGESETNIGGVYGNIGEGAASNTPGARSDFMTWTDSDGSFWLFGGVGIDEEGTGGYMNDLWKFDPTTQQWTWVSGSPLANTKPNYGTRGVPSESNFSGGRSGGVTWVGDDGTFWLFGGKAWDALGYYWWMSDLWNYNPATNEWKWVSGPSYSGNSGIYGSLGLPSIDNSPGSRTHAASFKDSNGDLWLFGGSEFGYYNDIFQFSPQTLEWTWWGGSEKPGNDIKGNYGVPFEGSTPSPGARIGSAEWVDEDGNLWLMGGGRQVEETQGFLGDLWKYEVDIKKWFYFGGSTKPDKVSASYGTKGLGSSSNIPPPRVDAVSWTGKDGKLWFFGGKSVDEARNDLWYYNSDENIYTWISGSSEEDQRGIYESLGEESNSIPGARFASSSWVDSLGMLWLFGGAERGSQWNKTFNDLWRYNPTTNRWTWVSGWKSSEVPGVFGTKGISAPSNQIGSKAYAGSWVDLDGNFWIFGGFGWDATGNIGAMNDLWKYDIQAKEWVWMHGARLIYDDGVYGEKLVPDPANYPPARYDFSSWTDPAGDFWLFGGTSGFIQYNDLWKYDVSDNVWIWVSGDQYSGGLSQYGEIGQGSVDNVIGARSGTVTFTGDKRNLFLFGGKNDTDFYSDLWEINFIPGLPVIESPHLVTQTSFTLNYDEAWTPEFSIDIASDEGFNSVFQSFNESDRSLTVSDLQPGTRYFYRANAQNGFGSSGFSATEAVLTLPPTPAFVPSVESRITNVTPTSAVVNWHAVEGVFDGYYLDVASTDAFAEDDFLAGYNSKPVAVEATSETIANLSSGSEYFVRLKSHNASGVSPYSEVVRVTTTPNTPHFTSGSEITNLTQTSFTLNWANVQGLFDGFVIEVSTDSTFSQTEKFVEGFKKDTLARDLRSVSLAGLQEGSLYYARLCAYNQAGYSAPSPPITILTLPETPIFAGQDFLTGVTQQGASLKWTAVPEIVAGYLLEISTDLNFSNDAFSLPGYGAGGAGRTIAKDSTSHRVKILEAGKVYYARVKASNSSGDSPYSNVITINTVPRSPLLNSITNITQTSAILTWAPATQASSYLIDLNTEADFQPSSFVLSEFPLAVPFYSFSALQPGQRYHVRVQSENQSGKSSRELVPDYGSTTFITIPAAPILYTPVNLTQFTAQLVWPRVKGAESYELDVSSNGFQTLLSEYNSLPVTDTIISVAGLEAGKVYQARVKALNTSGKSPVSNVQTVLTAPPTPIARDASSVATSSFRVNWDPVTGASAYIIEVSKDEFVTILYSDTLETASPVDVSGLEVLQVYQYRVRATNVSGSSPFSNTISVSLIPPPLPLSVTSLTFNPLFRRGLQQSEVKATATGGSGSLSASLRHREIATQEWSEEKAMPLNESDEFVFVVTPDILGQLGLEFEVSVTDGTNTAFDRDNFIRWQFDENQSDTIPISTFGGKRDDWLLFSIPYQLNDNLIETVFNELGGLTYKVDWRLLHFANDGDGGGKYVDSGEGINRIELGKSYWFNSVKPVKVNIGAGQINSEIPFQISLLRGWNQIGNPYNLPVSWENVIEENLADGTVESVKIYNPSTMTFLDGDVLEPFSGGFVWAESNVSLQVSPVAGSSSGRQADIPQRVDAIDLDNTSWKVQLELVTAGVTLPVGGFGMHPDASRGKDIYDRMTLPRFINYYDLYTVHNDYFHPWFSTDIVPDAPDHVWNFEFSSNDAGPAKLTWNNSEFEKSHAGLFLLDRSGGRLIDMKKENSYTLTRGSAQAGFAVYYQSDGSLPLPNYFQLGDAFPNPAETLVSIPVLLPEGGDRKVELSLFDLNGKLVETLASGKYASGFHLVHWTPSERRMTRSGVYFYRLIVNDGEFISEAKKLILE